MSDAITLGSLVTHPARGVGKVVQIDGPTAWIQFCPTGPSSAFPPEAQLPLQGLVRAAIQSDPHLSHVPVRLRSVERSKSAKKTVGTAPKRTLHTVEQAILWFQTNYPKLFKDPKLIRMELGYKREAHDLFVELFGNGRGRKLLRAKKLADIASGLNRLYHATNIPSRFEVMAANDGLKDHVAAARLLAALLDFVDSPDPSRFAELTQAVGSLPAPVEGSSVLTWPNVTILPFLADPQGLMVLKPTITKRMARRLQFPLMYSSSPSWHCYEALLRMTEDLRARLAHLGARDNIDVQSFIWVTQDLE